MNPLFTRLIKSLKGTRSRLLDVCEDLGIDPEDIQGEDIGIYPCTGCSTWHTKVIEDLDGNLICTYCDDIFGR